MQCNCGNIFHHFVGILTTTLEGPCKYLPGARIPPASVITFRLDRQTVCLLFMSGRGAVLYNGEHENNDKPRSIDIHMSGGNSSEKLVSWISSVQERVFWVV